LLFYAEMLEHLGKHKGVFIQHFNGKSDILTQLEVFITPQLLTEKKYIGVIVDADLNSQGTFASFQAAMEKATGQKVPAAGEWTEGAEGTPRLGVFIAPDSATQGEIETLVWRAWSSDPKNGPAKGCVDDFVCHMKEVGIEAKSPDKGLLGAFLAIRYDEDPRLGPATRRGVFDLGHSEFAALQEFLSRF